MSSRNAAKKRVRRLLVKIEQLKKKAGAERRRTGSVPLEKLLNRCLNHITALKAITALPKEDVHYALEYAWGVYMDLQNYDAPERQDYRADREISLNEVLDRINKSTVVPAEALSTDYVQRRLRLPHCRLGLGLLDGGKQIKPTQRPILE